MAVNPFQHMFEAFTGAFQSITGNKLSDEENKKLMEEAQKRVNENVAENGFYNPIDSAVKGTEFEALTTLVNSLNGVAKEIIAVPKYIFESAQTNPNVVASILVGIVGLLFMFKKGR